MSFDNLLNGPAPTYLPPDAQWIDHSGLGDATLIQTPATPHARAHEQLFWNRSTHASRELVTCACILMKRWQ